MACARDRKKLRTHERITGTLRNEIFAGKLQPGDAILEMEVARRHKVSQTTVREALVRLESTGLVRRIPNKGTFVTILSPQEYREHLRLRVLLEGLAGAEAAQRMTEEQLGELDQRLAAISEAVSRNDYFEAAQADLEFHRFLWRCSGNRTLYGILDRLTAPLFAYTSVRRSSGREDLRRVVRSHEPIARSLKQRDPEGTREAIRVHIEASYAHYLGSGLRTLWVPEPTELVATPAEQAAQEDA